MCDILVARGKATETGETVFAKNSDREPNEAQLLELHRGSEAGRKIGAEWGDESFAVIISRPWWMWGAEMGANEHGVVVGNTAVFTKEKVPEKGVLGMDYVRLALEKCDTARKALKLLKDCIARYGQGGNASYDKKLRYNNSFVIADCKDAYVLETVGRKWAYKKVGDIYTTSNVLTLTEHDEANFEGSITAYSDRMYTYFARGRERREWNYEKLMDSYGEITAELMVKILSHHPENYSPSKGSMRDVCMHYGGFFRPSQTAASQVSVLGDDARHLFTATLNPCLSLFKPVNFESELPPDFGVGSNVFSRDSYWWRNEAFRRRFQLSYPLLIGQFEREREKLQKKFLEMDDIAEMLRIERDFYDSWWRRVENAPLCGSVLWRRNWKKVNKKAKLFIF